MSDEVKDATGKALGSDSALVLDFGAAVARRAAEPLEPFLTNAERKELRAMLAWYRETRPLFEKIKYACPTARRLNEEG